MAAGDWKEMYLAALNGNLELVQYHIKNGVHPNYQHPEVLCTPLVASIIHGHDQVAFFLLDNGADPQLKSIYDNMTPTQAAKKHNRLVVLKKIKEKMPAKESVFSKITKLFS